MTVHATHIRSTPWVPFAIAAVAMGLALSGCVTSGGGQDPESAQVADGDAADMSELEQRSDAGSCEEVRLVERESGALSWSDNQMRSKPPSQVAVLPFWPTQKEFTGGAEPEAASQAVTIAFRNRLSQLPYNDIERAAVLSAVKTYDGHDLEPGDKLAPSTARAIGRELGADAVITGEVKRVNQLFLVAYSQIAVEVDLRMIGVESGCTRWRGEHVARGHEGGFTLDPVGTAFQVIKSLTSLNEHNRLIVIDRLARELVTVIPTPEDVQAEFGPELISAGREPKREWLAPQDTLRVEVATTKSLAEGSVRIGDGLSIPLEPREKGQDKKPFVYTAERTLRAADASALDGLAPGRVTGADADGYELDARLPGGRLGIDGERPDRPGNVRTRYRDGMARLAWDAAKAEDVTRYVIERSANAMGDFERIGTAKDTRFVDDSPLDPVGHYRVRAMDRAHQLSAAKETYAVHRVEPGPTDVPATIDSDTTWLAGASPYILDGEVTVPRGVELTVQPGTTIAAEPGARLIVEGRVVAEGTPAQPIRFAPRKADQSWDGLAITGATGAPSRLTHLEVRGASTAITVTSADPEIVKSTLLKNAVGLRVSNNAYPELRDNTLRNNGVGIKISATDPKVVGNTFRLNNRVDVAVEASAPILKNNDFGKGAPTAVRVAAGAGSGIVLAEQNWWGATDLPRINKRLNGAVRFKPVLNGPPPDGRPVTPTGRVQKASADAQRSASESAAGSTDGTASGETGEAADAAETTETTETGGEAAQLAKQLRRGMQAWRNDKDAKALELLTPIADDVPNNPTVQFALALLHFEKGQIETAETAARRAVKANPTSVNFHRTHGMILMRLGKNDAARAAFERALELDETDATSRTLLKRLEKEQV